MNTAHLFRCDGKIRQKWRARDRSLRWRQAHARSIPKYGMLKLNRWVDNLLALRLVNRMVDNQLDITFTALADPTRRGMLAALSLGEKPVSELAAPYDMSLAGAAKHVGVLARAGLIERRKVGRQQLCRLRGDRLKEASDWLGQWQEFWNSRLDALEAALKEDQE